MHRLFIAILSAGLVCAWPAVGYSQGGEPPEPETRMLDLLPSLIGDAAGDFNRAVVSQLSTFPLGSSAGGFTFTFDPARQTFSRSSDSFGPSFAERALTMGAGTFNVGVTYQRATYDHIEGNRLGGGEIRFLVADLPQAGDLVEARLDIDLTTDTTVLFMSYGLTDRIDVGTAIPYVRVDLDAALNPTLIRRNGQPVPGGFALESRSSGDSAQGLGDVMIRAKYNFLKREGGGATLVTDVSLPTGSADDLLGTGAPRAKFLFVTSTTLGRVSPHLNAGYTVVAASANPSVTIGDEYNYVAGVETVLSDRVTASFDLVARTITDIGRLRLGPASVPPDAMNDVALDQFAREPGNLNLRQGAVGVKWHVAGTWLLSSVVLFPLDDAGLTDQLTWSIGFDWTR